MISQYDQQSFAQYKPLSMQEIWAPAQQLREQHDKLQEEYAQQELLGGAASLGLQKGVDDVALATNQKYMDETKKAADELATKGFIDSGRRRSLMGLKQQYTQNVLPIQNALKERDAAIKMDREMKMKDSSYQTQFDPSKIAVTDYLKSNTAFSTKGVSGQEVYKDAAQALSTLKDVATSELPALKGSGIMDKFFTVMKQGLSPEQAAALMQKQSRSQAESESWSKLAKMTVSAIDGAMQRHGVYDIFKDNPKMIDKFWQDTSKAAIFAVGTPKIGEMTDEYGRAQREANAANADSTPAYRPVPTTTVEGEAKTTNISKDLDWISNVIKNPDMVDTGKYIKNYRISGAGLMPTEQRDSKGKLIIPKGGYELGKAPGQEVNTGYSEYNSKRFEKLKQEYGVKTPQELAKAMQRKIDKSAITSNTFVLNNTDNKYVAQMLSQNASTMAAKNGSTGLHEYSDGKKGDQIDADEIASYITESGNPGYDPETDEIVYSNIVDKKPKNLIVDPKLVGDFMVDHKGRAMDTNEYIQQLKNFKSKDNLVAYRNGIDHLLRSLRTRFNDLAKVQSSTSSK